MLKEKLYRKTNWGKNKTDSYYAMWDTLANGQLEEGGYVDLFYFSDALILDSTSFTVEYLYFNKPLLFTMRDHAILGRFNSFGQKVFDYMYHAHQERDINKFIDNVINGIDSLKKDRQRFFERDVLPQNGKTASQNIYEELKNEFC